MRDVDLHPPAGPVVSVGLAVGGILFLVCALAGSKHALFIPAIVLLAAAAANVIAGPL